MTLFNNNKKGIFPHPLGQTKKKQSNFWKKSLAKFSLNFCFFVFLQTGNLSTLIDCDHFSTPKKIRF